MLPMAFPSIPSSLIQLYTSFAATLHFHVRRDTGPCVDVDIRALVDTGLTQVLLIIALFYEAREYLRSLLEVLYAGLYLRGVAQTIPFPELVCQCGFLAIGADAHVVVFPFLVGEVEDVPLEEELTNKFCFPGP